MKRTVALIAGVATLATGLGVGAYLRAQQGGTAPAAPPAVQSKIAIVNLNQIIKGYKQTNDFQNEFKGVYQGYENAIRQLTTDMAKMQEDFQKATTQADKDRLEKAIKDAQRTIQDKKEEGQKKLSEKELEQMKSLYNDVEQMVALMAKSRGLELVLHYNDSYTDADKHNPMNVQRKLTTLACMPVYAVPGIDLSEEVTKYLNWNYDQRHGKAATPATGGAPAGH